MSDEQTGMDVVAAPVGHEGARVDISERPARAINGWLGVLTLFACVGGAIGLALSPAPGWLAAPVVMFFIVAFSLVVVAPGETWVVLFFGRYVGTLRHTGLSWVLPFTVRRRVSVRVRNFETNHLKVNDYDGNPVEIRIPAGIQSGETLRHRGAGMSLLNSRGRGDLVARVLVETPTRLSARQRELLRQFRETETGEECPASKGFLKRMRSFLEG